MLSHFLLGGYIGGRSEISHLYIRIWLSIGHTSHIFEGIRKGRLKIFVICFFAALVDFSIGGVMVSEGPE